MTVIYSSQSGLNPQTIPSWASQQNVNTGLFSSQTYTGLGSAQSKPRQLFEGEGHNPDIDAKLRSMIPEKHPVGEFFASSSDDAIHALGDVEPMFGHSLTCLAEALLRCAPDPRSGYDTTLARTGLFYQMPHVFAMPSRIRTSFVGLSLLDHWASKNKRFATYVDTYIDQQVRDNIAADCFQLSMGHMPKWIKDAVAHGEKLQRRWQEKEAKRQAVEQERRRLEQMEMQKYYNQLNQQIVQSPTTWTSMTQSVLLSSSMHPDQKSSLLQQRSGLFK